MKFFMVIIMVIRKVYISFKDFELNYRWLGIKSLILLGDVYDSNVYVAFLGRFEQYRILFWGVEKR